MKIGQRLFLDSPDKGYCLAAQAGRITARSNLTGTFGQQLVEISISTTEDLQEYDEEFSDACRDPSLEKASLFFRGLPGRPDFLPLTDPRQQIERLVILGVDDDVQGCSNGYLVKHHINSVLAGITLLKKITGLSESWLFVPDYLEPLLPTSSSAVRTVKAGYPEANREVIRKRICRELNIPVADDRCAFFSAEAACALSAVCSEDTRIPGKILTFVDKCGKQSLVSTPVGTPVREILQYFGETLHEGDRLVIGGPMKGTAVFSVDFPVSSTTNAIMVQDRRDIVETEDVACVNCGACVRVCPVDIQVNMLIRVLEVGEYEEAASRYNLFSCIDCGLCSYVCEARIAVFQHIRIAKTALDYA
ncbi:4Fe-4S dicluster domain-containing protein [Desulfofustis glycolicus]|uniref:4Fe-4S dicluster domain-containing protein n=1 Tax=Desulfofustis glycolicus TaxID=51195 RepID=UPI0013799B32|nr:4Fe-4S dicluster domain-containing protein [Desulfofustis glycolicus]